MCRTRHAWSIAAALLALAVPAAAADFALYAEMFTNLGARSSPAYTGPDGTPHEAIQFYYDAPARFVVSDVYLTPSAQTRFRPDAFDGFGVSEGFFTTSKPGNFPDPGVDRTPTLLHEAFPLSGNEKAGGGAFFQPRVRDRVDPTKFYKNAEVIRIAIDSLVTIGSDGTPELRGPVVGVLGNDVTAEELLSPPAATAAHVTMLFRNLNDLAAAPITLEADFTGLETPALPGLFATTSARLAVVPEPGPLALLTAAALALGVLLLRRRPC